VLIILWRFHMSSDFCLIQRSEFKLSVVDRQEVRRKPELEL